MRRAAHAERRRRTPRQSGKAEPIAPKRRSSSPQSLRAVVHDVDRSRRVALDEDAALLLAVHDECIAEANDRAVERQREPVAIQMQLRNGLAVGALNQCIPPSSYSIRRTNAPGRRESPWRR
jgi:hypothetical protein